MTEDSKASLEATIGKTITKVSEDTYHDVLTLQFEDGHELDIFMYERLECHLTETLPHHSRANARSHEGLPK